MKLKRIVGGLLIVIPLINVIGYHCYIMYSTLKLDPLVFVFGMIVAAIFLASFIIGLYLFKNE